jgi:hypothetical protein
MGQNLETIEGVWELNRCPLSLGGLLNLRFEMEELARRRKAFSLRLTLVPVDQEGGESSITLAREVLRGSFFASDIHFGEAPENAWPSEEIRNARGFSYPSCERISRFWRETGVRPKLIWNEEILSETRVILRGLPGRVYAVHLKQVEGATRSESNANLTVWSEFLRGNAIPKVRSFILLGKDKLPDVFLSLPAVYHAETMGLSLSIQLCLEALSHGFIGMAAGFSAVAILGDIPYVVLKNPSHHSLEMVRELGDRDGLEFALKDQKIWRREDSRENLERGLKLLEDRYVS